MIMNPNENKSPTLEIVGKSLFQLIKKSRDELDKINSIKDGLKKIESDKPEKLIQLFDIYHDKVNDEYKTYGKIVAHFEKLIPIYKAKAEIYSEIQEESDELFEQI